MRRSVPKINLCAHFSLPLSVSTLKSCPWETMVTQTFIRASLKCTKPPFNTKGTIFPNTRVDIKINACSASLTVPSRCRWSASSGTSSPGWCSHSLKCPEGEKKSLMRQKKTASCVIFCLSWDWTHQSSMHVYDFHTEVRKAFLFEFSVPKVCLNGKNLLLLASLLVFAKIRLKAKESLSLGSLVGFLCIALVFASWLSVLPHLLSFYFLTYFCIYLY